MDPAQELEAKLTSLHQHFREAEERGGSEIQKMYQGTSIFITGGSGFVGKQLTEKLLRSCRQIDKIYLLLREKKNKTVLERMTKQFNGPVYDELRKVFPDFEKKFQPIEGDIRELKLGIRDEDWKLLTNKVNIIIHIAATVRFDEPIKTAIISNVRGTREVIRLARECRDLKSFAYISTAYSHCYMKSIKEIFYKSPVQPETMIDLVETVDEEILDGITAKLIKQYPNTYTFSKAIAEEAVRVYGKGLPACIIRPAIVTPAYREPALGWLDISNVFGPSSVILGPSIGLIRVLLANKDAATDVVPVDYVNNLTIAACWDTAKRYKEGDEEMKIFTLSRYRNRLRIDDIVGHKEVFLQIITPRSAWYTYLIVEKNKYLFWILSFLLHFVPAFLIDVGLTVMRYKFRLMSVYKQVYKLSTLISHFMLHTWDHHDENTVSLKAKMSDLDQDIFNFDMGTMGDLTTFLQVWLLGIRRFIIKDGLQDTVYGCKKQKYLKILHYIVMVIYMFVLWKIGNVIFYFFSWFFSVIHYQVC